MGADIEQGGRNRTDLEEGGSRTARDLFGSKFKERKTLLVACAVLLSACVIVVSSVERGDGKLADTLYDTATNDQRGTAQRFPVELAQTQKLQVTVGIEKALALARLHSHANEGVHQQVEDETTDSEEWSRTKVREMVARLFKAVTALDQRVTDKYSSLKDNIRDVKQHALGKNDAEKLVDSKVGRVEGGIKAASSKLQTVLAAEHTMRSLVTAQGKVSDEEAGREQAKIKRVEEKEDSTQQELAAEKQKVEKWREQNKEEEEEESIGDEGPAMLSVLEALGVQEALDQWCNAPGNCHLAHGKGTRLFARRSTGDGDNKPAWRCYAAGSLSGDLSRYSHGQEYCTHDTELKQVLAAQRDAASALLAHTQHSLTTLQDRLSRVVSREESLAKRQGVDDGKLAVIGPDLNLFERRQGTLKGLSRNVSSLEHLNSRAIVALDSSVGTLSQNLLAVERKEQADGEEDSKQLLAASQKLVRQIALKMEEAFRVTEGQIRGVSHSLAAALSSDKNRTHALEEEMAGVLATQRAEAAAEQRDASQRTAAHKIHLTLETDDRGDVSLEAAHAPPLPVQTLTAAFPAAHVAGHVRGGERDVPGDVTPHSQPARQTGSAVIAPQLQREAGRDDGKNKGRHRERKSSHQDAGGGRKSGCLIHLSGVVHGLHAGNSIEC